jgi:hypothetical protein
MDERALARRVRALRAMSVDPAATDSERAAHKAKADALEQKYGRSEPPISYPRVTSTAPTESHSAWVGPTARGKTYYAQFAFNLWMPYTTEDLDLDDIVESGYLYNTDDYDDE